MNEAVGPTVSSDLARILLSGVSAGGDTLRQLLTAAGIDPTVLQTPHRRITARQFQILWDALETSSNDPHFGLHLGTLASAVPTGHVLFSVMLNSATVGHALQRYCRYHDIMANIVRPQLIQTADSWTLRLAPHADVCLHRQHVECIVSVTATLMELVSQRPFRGMVRFAHPCPGAPDEYRQVLGPNVTFDQPHNEVEIAAHLLGIPLAAADPQLLAIVEDYAASLLKTTSPQPTWSARVARLVGATLCDGKPRIGDVARKLAVSKRALQRSLEVEGTTFRSVVDATRKELATEWLSQSDMGVAEVAFLLGYSDQSAFTHAFRKWTGNSPARYRAQQQREPASITHQ